MVMYNTVQTGENTQFGGVSGGLFKVAYQGVISFLSCIEHSLLSRNLLFVAVLLKSFDTPISS